MSSSGAGPLLHPLDGHVVSFVDQSVVYPTQYIVAISLSILLYDYALTVCNEVKWMWKSSHKSSPIVILFFVHRYWSILIAPALIVQYFWDNADLARMSALTSFHHATIFLSQSIMGAILIIRTYALYNRSRWVIVLFGAIALSVVATAIWAQITSPYITFRQNELPPRGCIVPIPLKSIQTYLPSILLGVFGEVLVFGLTLYKSVQVIRRENSIVLRVLLRDGALYFGVVMAANIAVIVSYYVFDDYSRGNIVTLANSLFAVLVSRLILNLRDPSLANDFRFRKTYHQSPDSAGSAMPTMTNVSDIMTSVTGTSRFYNYAGAEAGYISQDDSAGDHHSTQRWSQDSDFQSDESGVVIPGGKVYDSNSELDSSPENVDRILTAVKQWARAEHQSISAV